MTVTKRNRFFSPVVLACLNASLLMACGKVLVGNPADGPTVAEVSPARASTKGITEIVVTGTGFSDDTQVIVGTTRATDVTIDGEGSLRFVAPASATSGQALDLQVFNDKGFALVADSITYNARPILGNITPRIFGLAGGDIITITGEHFDENRTGTPVVHIGGAAATDVVVVDNQTITAVSAQQTPADVAIALDIAIETDNGDSLAEEAGVVLGKGFFFGTSRFFTEAEHGLYFFDMASSRTVLVHSLPSSVGRFVREPGGAILARFGNRGDAALGASVYGRIDLIEGTASPLVAFKRAGTTNTVRTRAATGSAAGFFAITDNREVGRLDPMTEEFTGVVSVPGEGRSACLVPGPTPETLMNVGDFDEGLRLIDVDVATVTEVAPLTGDISPGAEVRCHGGAVLDGVFYAIQFNRQTAETTLVTIQDDGVVTFVAELPSGAAGLLATQNGQ